MEPTVGKEAKSEDPFLEQVKDLYKYDEVIHTKCCIDHQSQQIQNILHRNQRAVY